MNKQTSTLTVAGLATCVVLCSLISLIMLSLPKPKAQEAQPQTASATPAAQPSETSEVDAEPTENTEEETVDERTEFVNEWAPRIDAFNAGYPLDGYGQTFAEAAYDNGVDPRLSPAIARVESGSGNHCTYDHNAWGWGSYSWPDWESAINGHIQGMASGYGYTLSEAMAQSYAPEESDEWYGKVESCLEQI